MKAANPRTLFIFLPLFLGLSALGGGALLKYNELSFFFKTTFNDFGEIAEMETKRYTDVNNLETWVI